MVDFFISYSGADRAWAEWIAFELESNGLTVIFQARDFVQSATVVGEIDRALGSAQHAILVCSHAYLTSTYTLAEYHSAVNREKIDPSRLCIPIRVDPDLRLDAMPPLLLAKVITDLVPSGTDDSEARNCLAKALSQVPQLSVVPTVSTRPAPRFPGAAGAISVWDFLRGIKGHCQSFRRVREVHHYVALFVCVIFGVGWAIGLIMTAWLSPEQSLLIVLVTSICFMVAGAACWRLHDCAQKIDGLMLAIDARNLDDVKSILRNLTCARLIKERALTYVQR